jgi:hypothetical protein
MSIDLDSFPLPLYEKDREGPEPNRRTETDSTHSRMARPRALGGSAGSFPVVLFPPRERRTEEVWYAQRVEYPLRVSVVSVGNSTIFSPIVLKKKGKCYGPLLFDLILTGDEPRLP